MMSPVFGPLMAVAALAIGAGIVVLYRRGLGAILVRQAESEMVKAAAPVTAAEALAEAAKQDALARYREACHFLLLATLLWIEEKGLARFNRSATNREHLTQLASVAEVPDRRLVVALEPAIARFDRVWYGQAFVSHADYRDLLTLAGRVRDSLA